MTDHGIANTTQDDLVTVSSRVSFDLVRTVLKVNKKGFYFIGALPSVDQPKSEPVLLNNPIARK